MLPFQNKIIRVEDSPYPIDPNDTFVCYRKIISNSDILSLPTKPIEIVPSPGNGKYNRLFICNLLIDLTDGDYTNIDPTSQYLIVDNPLNAFISDIGQSGFFTAFDASKMNYGQLFFTVYTSAGVIYGSSVGLNTLLGKAMYLVVQNGAAGDFTGGGVNNVLTLDTWVETVEL